jgi:hypothetical protein
MLTMTLPRAALPLIHGTPEAMVIPGRARRSAEARTRSANLAASEMLWAYATPGLITTSSPQENVPRVTNATLFMTFGSIWQKAAAVTSTLWAVNVPSSSYTANVSLAGVVAS